MPLNYYRLYQERLEAKPLMSGWPVLPGFPRRNVIAGSGTRDTLREMPGPELIIPAEPASIDAWCGRVWQGDSLDLMKHMPDQCVDMILADLPYGTTKNKWDTPIDLDALWKQYLRIAKDTAPIVLTAAQPFTSVLVCSNLKMFRYEWIWEKTIGSGQLNVKYQPLRVHESVLVFYQKRGIYNPQMTEGAPYQMSRKVSSWSDRGYNEQRDHETVNSGTRYPRTVLKVSNPRTKGGHPTQKPVELFQYLIKTYTNPDAVVLDNVIGAGTTGVAAVTTGRRFIGMELDPKYVDLAETNIAAASRKVASERLVTEVGS